MGKKVAALAVTAVIVVIWVATLHGIGPINGNMIGPISKDIKLGLDIKGGVYVVMEAQTDESDPQELSRLMEQTKSIIESRVNEMGLSEPIVTIEGDKRIRVELPGAEDADEAIDTVGKTAQLRFLLADGSDALSGADIEDSGVDRAERSALYVVTLEFNAEGQRKFFEATTTAYNRTIPQESVMKPIVDEVPADDAGAESSGAAIDDETTSGSAADMAASTSAAVDVNPSSAATDTSSDAAAETPDLSDGVLRYMDQSGNVITNPNGFPIDNGQIIIVLDNEIISAPSVDKGPIDSRSAIIEEFSLQEATDLSMLIRGGALPVELLDVESSEIGASIGMGALQDSVMGGVIGIALVLIFMFIMYRIFGLAANLALLLYIPLVLWWMVITKAVLTLPGIAGIVLSIGMAVDANVIIISRIREEVGNGKTIRVAQRDGTRKALSAVLDSQITTIIAALVLYQLGTGPVRGFAFTLASGIVIGLITAIFIANIYTQNFIDSPLLKHPFLLGVKEGESTQLKRRFNFIKHRKIFYIITVVILAIGIGVGVYHGQDNHNIRFGNEGIDFSGGTRLQIDMEQQVSDDEIRKTLEANGITDAELVRYGDDGDGVIIKTTKSMNADERQEFLGKFLGEYGLTDDSVDFFEQFGPSIGRMLTDKAIQAVLWAALFMLIYISIRFKWRYGVASLIAVFHDVAILFAMYGLFNITINNPFIAAVLTVVGYSINDTIVIFDRIRENFGLMSGRMPLTELLDTSINQTLVRSLMTGMSTILAIIPLIIFGGDTIREFVVPLLIGIIAGACSSIFIASPVYYELTRIGSGGEGVAGYKRSRSNYEESVAKAKAAKKAKRKSVEELPETTAPAGGAALPETDGSDSKSGKDDRDGKGGGDKPPSGGGGGKGRNKKSRKKRKSSRTGGAVV
jgi:SecD/SecF fusion protein